MSQLVALKAASSIHDLANILGFKAKAIAYILHRLPEAAKYRQFLIAKKNGGTRLISVPTDDLKLLQKRVSDLIQNCIEESNLANGWIDHHSHGFSRGRSIITNASKHRRRRSVFNLDLQDFFGSINFGRVRGYFISDRSFALHRDVATILAQIVCLERQGLPQGSPSSPAISNLIGHILDVHLARLAHRTGCTYTRYADDLTFSTNKAAFSTAVAMAGAEPHKWVPGTELSRIILRGGFSVNSRKTRLQYKDSRQEVTGLVVNSKVNIPSEYRHNVRAMAHRLFITGTFDCYGPVLNGDGALERRKRLGTLAQLHGMFGHIDSVDRYNKKQSEKNKGSVSKEVTSLNTKEHLYRRFLLFKEFYAAAGPVLICEGKTDNIYLEGAIIRLAANFPSLATRNADGTVTLKIKIYKYSESSTSEILRLHNGTGEMGNFIRDYIHETRKFKAPGKRHPVICLIDNDSGAIGKGKPFNVVKDITGSRPTGQELFTFVGCNLYVVATPPLPGSTSSMIENFFDSATLNTPVAGKYFHPLDNTFDKSLHITKHVFSVRVVKPNVTTIDFGGFGPLLGRLDAVLQAHRTTHPLVPPLPVSSAVPAGTLLSPPPPPPPPPPAP